MSIGYNLLRVHVDLGALLENFKTIQAHACCPVPIIKADAYGHGLSAVASTLIQGGATMLAAGTVAEAATLKEQYPDLEVFSLLGPVDKADYELICAQDLIVFITRVEQLLLLEEAARQLGTPLRVALKFDTGMSRLGFDAQEALSVANVLDGLEYVRATWACSHLATADDPDQRAYVLEQGQRLTAILQLLRGRGLDVRASLANSGAIFAFPELHYDLQRPGLALYGGNPFYGTSWQDKVPWLAPVMGVSTKILNIRTLKAGQSVSYGRTFISKSTMRIGILALGYADNYSRALSGQGWVLLHGQRVPILGRVCMQLTAVDLTQVPEAQVGDAVYLLGGPGPEAILAHELATWWGTISYEVFCLLGQNSREYHGGHLSPIID